MTRLNRLGALLGGVALTALASLPALAQDDDGGVYVLTPGTVIVGVEGADVTYQVPATVAVEVCPEIDAAYLATDFAGTLDVVCVVTQEVAETRFVDLDSENDGGDDAGEAESEAAPAGDAGGVDAGDDAAGDDAAGGDAAGGDAAGGDSAGDDSGTNEGEGATADSEEGGDAEAEGGGSESDASEGSSDDGATGG